MTWPAAIGLYICLVVPSLAAVQKFSGLPGVVLYAVGTGVALQRLPAFRLRVGSALPYALGTLAAVAVLFLIGHPLANSGIYGPGSDTDEAYNVAVAEMLSGRYPYYARTYLGGAVHHLPGGLALATPFVLLGTSAYQNLFWLCAFFGVAWKELQTAREALLMAWVLLLLCPIVLYQVVTGVDGIANTVAVVATFWMLARAEGNGTKVVATILFALALSNRPNFLLVLPIVFALLGRQWGWKAAAIWMGAISAALAAINLPFYFYDPPQFGPLEGVERLTRFEGVLPGAPLVLPGLAACLAMGFALRVCTFRSALAGIAVVQGFLVVAGTGLTMIQTRTVDFSFAGYGTFFLFPGGLAAWSYWRVSPP